jgi:hypothetical protein
MSATKVQVTASPGGIEIAFVIIFIVPLMLIGALVGMIAGPVGSFVGLAGGIYLTFKAAKTMSKEKS